MTHTRWSVAICTALVCAVSFLGIAADIDEFDAKRRFAFLHSRLVEAGDSYTFTNSYIRPFRLASVQYDGPSGITNTLTMTLVHDYVVSNQYAGTTVVTNFDGFVETNTYNTITNTVTTPMTNDFPALPALTNTPSPMYDEDDFGKDVYVVGGDRLTFSWSYTNSDIKLKFVGIQ